MNSTKKTGRNPFAFFSGEEEFGSSDDESSADEGETVKKSSEDKLSFISKSETDRLKTGKILPSADEVFSEVSKPVFLTNKVDETEWERFVKSDIKDNTDPPPVEGSTHAMPPPKSYDIVTETLKPSIGDTSGDHRQEGHDTSGKRPLQDEDEDDEPHKKLKDE